MTRKLTIYFICGAGLGSSLACQMTAEDVLNRLGLDENLEHEAISSTPGLRTASLSRQKILLRSSNNMTSIQPSSLSFCTTLLIQTKSKPSSCQLLKNCRKNQPEQQSVSWRG